MFIRELCQIHGQLVQVSIFHLFETDLPTLEQRMLHQRIAVRSCQQFKQLVSYQNYTFRMWSETK
jgi:hypothetical protein